MKIPNDKKCLATAGLVVLLALAMVSFSFYFSRKAESNVYIRAFNSVGAIPSAYWFDLQTTQHGISFIGPQKDRIVLGAVDDLKNEFWSFVGRDKVNERSLCGVKVITLFTEGVRSVLITDQTKYIYFVGSPEAVPQEFINVLCRKNPL